MKIGDILDELNADFVANALLQHNYLPTQKEDKDELPSVFTSKGFTVNVAQKLINGKRRKKDGFDTVEYKLTRFNGVSRICSIPHPAAYADLAVCIRDNWNAINYISENENSVIRPRRHDDGRIIIMDYESSVFRVRRELKSMFSRRFMVRTDISNCFPTVYSHAVPWALVGFPEAKKKKKERAEWFNQLDEKIRWLKRNETQGVAIGPATSNIISEIILARIDEKMRDASAYVRFIDDYTGYFDTEDDARSFVRNLEGELARYKLLLNAKKTQIIELPQPLEDNWITELTLRLPKTNGTEKVPRNEAIRYLNFAVNLAKQSPDGSVLKYALKSLLKQTVDDNAKMDVLHFALQLCFHHPILIPVLKGILKDFSAEDIGEFTPQLEELALQNAIFHRSDGMVWTLHFLALHKLDIEEKVVEEVVKTRDSMSLLMIYTYGNDNQKAQIVQIATELINEGDNFEIDQHWMLLYQLYRDGRILNPYAGEDSFEILKDSGVSFVEINESKAE